ncbi:hypothetical protein JCM10908_005497 [Rhodotorula pacifica]|uniref:uncharacterized protein n=1 Tax=Rhodotorula pacifica TaxID=1495444 RepID=UPI00316BD9E0
MGLFTRKKRRDQEPVQSFVGPAHAQQGASERGSIASEASSPSASSSSARPTARGPAKTAPSAPSSRFLNTFSSSSSSASQAKEHSPPPPPPIAKSPHHEYNAQAMSGWNGRNPHDVSRPSTEWSAPPDRGQLFSGAYEQDQGSVLSLPALATGRPSLDVLERQRQTSAGAPLQAEEEHTKRSRWRIGRSAPKPRQNSSGSMLDHQGQALDTDEGSGFVVKSFRTVSRVHEDPIPIPAPATVDSILAPPAPVLPTTSQFARPSMDSLRYDSHQHPQHQVESLRPSLDLEAEPVPRSQPRRPSLATLGNGRPSSQSFGGGEREGPGTISAEAFRLASARSKSAISLASLDGQSSPPLESSRPRFEPQRPQSRMSRRGSNYSDAGSSILIPPRPSFAIGRHSNGSGSSIDSRSSSTSNGPGGSPATPASTLPYETASPASPPLGQSRLSFSSPSRPISPPPSARDGTAAPVRPSAHRMSTGDSELRLIAAYGDMISSSPPQNNDLALPDEASPADRPPNRSRASFSAESAQRPRLVTAASDRSSIYEHGPSFAVQPPTPQSRTEEPFNRPKRTSSLQPDSVGKALQAMGVGKPAAAASRGQPANNKKGKALATRGWTSDSSEEELERLSTSDEEESDDEVPLAAIRSRSQTDLTLTAGGLRSRTSFETTRTARADSGEVEVLADRMARVPPFASTQQKRLSQAQLGASTLARRGSNRRSVSTLSFSTSMTVSQAAATSNAATPILPPSSQRVPYQTRSVSNPSASTLPSFAAAGPTAPSSGTDTTASSALPSPLLQSTSRDRSSASSGSATTSSSFPHTPKDRSPAVSTIGLDSRSMQAASKPSGHASKPSVKFDLATAMSTIGEPRTQRLSMLGAASRSTPNLLPGGSTLSLAPPVPSPFASPKYQREFGQSASTVGAPSKPSQETSVPTGTLNDRLKARHRAEAMKAIQIGRELNDPSGLVPDHEAQEALLGGGDGSDENEPLANLPSRGSMIGGMGRGPAGPASMLSGFGGIAGGGLPMTGLPGMGAGGQYSQLAIPPPGVDPYLYASLPPDQKMSLHQRSQQMMAMMQEAAVQAKAESVMGGGGGGGSTLSGHGGSRPIGHSQSMSMGTFDAFAAAAGGMGMPYGYPQQHQHPMMMMQQHQHQQHMPPFAPPFAMSQHFFQPQFPQQYQPHQFYGMPAYAGSAIGFSGGHGVGQPAAPSAIGIPSKASGMSAARRPAGHGRPASAIGTGHRA